MSDTLRATQQSYQRQLEQIDLKVKGHEDAIADLKKQRTDVEGAKAVVDDAVAKLPPEKAQKKSPDQKGAGK